MTTLKEKLIDCLPDKKELPKDKKWDDYQDGFNTALAIIKLHSIDKMMSLIREEMIKKSDEFISEYKKDGSSIVALQGLKHTVLELLSTPSVGEVE